MGAHMLKRQVPELSLLSYIEGDRTDKIKFVDAFFSGIKDYGFIILTDHPLEQSQIALAYELSGELFALPQEVKEGHSGEGEGGQRGYTSFGKEHAKDYPYPDLKEFWHVGREVPSSHPYSKYYPPNVWPQEIPPFYKVMSELYHSMDKISLSLLNALGEALDISENYFSEMIYEGNSVLRLIHYPPVSSDMHPQSVRAAAHGDINLITLLVGATDNGLQLLDRNGAWLDVNSKPGQLVVDSGDMLSRITNDIIPATIHRVVNPNNSRSRRYSMPYFVHPHPQAMLSCISSCEGTGAKYPPILSHEFLMERLHQIGLR